MDQENVTNIELRPLSEAQLGIWFAQMLNTNKALYNIGEALEILGPLNAALFETALRRVVAASDSLHLQFVETEEGLRQFCAPKLDWPLPIVDLTSERHPAAAATEWMYRAMARSVDLTREPLFDYALLRTAADRFIWYSRYHHLCNDGFGTSLVSRRVAELYTKLAHGHVGEAEPTRSWFTLIDKEQEYRRSLQYQRDRDYWRSQFADRPDRVTLAGGPPSWPDDFVRCTAELAPADTDVLRDMAARHRTSLSQVLTTVAAIYVHRMTGGRNMTLGTTVTARHGAESQRIPGMMSNVLPLRLDVDPSETFATLLRKVVRGNLEGMLHQRYRAEDLRRDLGLRPSDPEIFGPLINVCSFDYKLGFAGIPVRARNVGNWRVDDVEFVFYDRRDSSGLSIDFCGNPKLYSAETLNRHLRRFVRLLKTVATVGQDLPLHRLQLLAPDEQHRVLEEFNNTAVAYPNGVLVHGLFEEQVKRTPDATALIYEQQALSYAALNRRANQLAHYLIGLGLHPDDRVAICMERSLEMVIALLGVLKAGGAYVPLDPNYPAERLVYMLRDSAPAALLTQPRLQAKIPETELPVLVLGTSDEVSSVARQPTSNPEASALGLTARNLAYVIYTSGSTGQPKGAMNEHHAVVNRLLWMQDEYRLGERDRVLQKTPFGFDVSVWEFFWPLLVGAKLVMARPGGHQDPPYLIRLIEEAQITTVHFVPSMLQIFLDAHNPGQCNGLRHIVCSGEELPTSLERRCLARLPAAQVHNLYGPTEAAVDVTYWNCRRDTEVSRVPIGRPIANTRIYILDEHRQPVPVGVTGEIFIGGVAVGRGYLNRPELTAEKFVDDPFNPSEKARMYRTGDLGRWLDDGNAEYLGRNDFQVKLRGLRVELGEIEAKLMECTGVREAVVVAREDRPGDKRLVAYLVAHETGKLNGAHLREQLRAALPEYMVPSAFVTMKALPLSPNGKLDRRALPAPDRDAYAARALEAQTEEIEGELRKDERVEDAIVAVHEQNGRRFLVAYVTTREKERVSQHAEHTEHWQQLYDLTYASGAAAAADFNIAGWNSSYTGEPISPDEMRLWVEEQTARIRALQPRRVLEIGCGTGLLVTRLAGSCESYVGLDFSGEALAQLQGYLAQRADLGHVQLRRGLAHELGFMADDSVDLVILNSVVQYFPDTDYLLKVLGEAVRITRRGGHIFVGDIRNLLLLDAYHTSVQLYRAEPDLSLDELRSRVIRARQNEEELLVDPALFGELASRWDKLSRMEISPKTGSYDNELSRFRYDITLTLGDKEALAPPRRWVSWDTKGSWRQALLDEMAGEQSAPVGLRGIRDGRAASAVEATRLSGKADAQLITAGDLRAAAAKSSGADPHELLNFARQSNLPFSWHGFRGDGTYDMIFNARWDRVGKAADAPRGYYRRFANTQGQSRGDAELAHALKRRLHESLAREMVPATILVLRAWPLTLDGEVDRSALPAPEYHGEAPDEHPRRRYRAPRTPTEDLLAAIWAETLGLDRVGIDENFFDLGGHSLLAMQLFTRIRKTFGKNLPMATLFEAPTISQVATAIEQKADAVSWASLRAIRSEGTRPPLFLVPGVGGNVICFHDLAQLLGEQQPVYGLQSRGLDGLEQPFGCLEDIAAHFVREVRTVQPQGPYYLGGACIGGVVAFEMAQQLAAAGQQVAMLAMLESWPPSAHRARLFPMYLPPQFSVPVAIAVGLGRILRALTRMRPGQWLTHSREKWEGMKQIVGNRDASRSEAIGAYTDLVTRSNYWAMFKYFPKIFPGRLVLILAAERPLRSRDDARLRWQKFAQKGCNVHYSRGRDSGIMLTKPHVEELARLLDGELAFARAQYARVPDPDTAIPARQAGSVGMSREVG